MIDVETYEKLYCTYCDSQRCQHIIGTTIDEICPYWKERQNLEESNESNK